MNPQPSEERKEPLTLELMGKAYRKAQESDMFDLKQSAEQEEVEQQGKGSWEEDFYERFYYLGEYILDSNKEQQDLRNELVKIKEFFNTVVRQQRAEAVATFAEKLKEHHVILCESNGTGRRCVLLKDIDQLAKEE